MGLMTKPKPKRTSDADKKVRPAIKEGRARPFSMEMDTPMYEVLDRFAREDRREKKTIVMMALEQFFAAKGLWPPKPS